MAQALPSTALLTDHYELTMLDAALQAGTGHRPCAFEVFGRRLPRDRAYSVVAGTGRLLDLLAGFRFGDAELDHLAAHRIVSASTLDWLAGYRFTGDVDGYPEGELFFPNSPILTVRADFATGVVLETLILSVLNHDVAVASAASRMWVQAAGRPLIEMGSRRTHERAAVAAARAAWIAGFEATSNLEAGRTYGIPTAGTAAHAFTLLHDSEESAFAAQVAALGTGTTLLVDTYDTLAGVRAALAVAGPGLGAVRLDSGDLGVLARQVRAILDGAGASGTQVVATSDLDEYRIAELAVAPIDRYGVGTSVVTGSGSPAAGLVFKVVEVEGRPVAKRSAGGKSSQGGRKVAFRAVADGAARAEIIRGAGPGGPGSGGSGPGAAAGASAGNGAGAGIRSGSPGLEERPLVAALMRAGERVDSSSLADARARHAASVAELPEAGRALRADGPAIPVVRE